MAQLAAYITPPAARASGDARSPVGALGTTSRSHPEMTSESANRARPVGSFWLPDHLVAKAVHLADNGSDEFMQLIVDSGRTDHRQIDGGRNETEQRHRGRVTVDEVRGIKQVGNPDLVRRQTVAHRATDVLPVE